MKHLTLAIDFDGTIVEEAWPEIGPLEPWALEALQALHADGHYLVLNTCRKGPLLADVREFLKAKRVYGLFETINRNSPRRIREYGGDVRKLSADVYIDDRNLGGLPRRADGRVDWPAIYRIVSQLARVDETTAQEVVA